MDTTEPTPSHTVAIGPTPLPTTSPTPLPTAGPTPLPIVGSSVIPSSPGGIPEIEYILFKYNEIPFTLRIPFDHIRTCTYKPVQWLRYVGWAFLGIHGKLVEIVNPSAAVEEIKVVNEDEVNLADPLRRKCYRFEPDEPIKWDENTPIFDLPRFGESNSRHDEFKSLVQIRDGACIVTSQCDDAVVGYHLFHHTRRNEAQPVLLRRRGLLTDEINGVDDIRNGVLLGANIYPWFDKLKAAFLVTPNDYLSMTDVPRASCADSQGFTSLQSRRTAQCGAPVQRHSNQRRYTFQYIVHNAETDRYERFDVRENTDAVFVSPDLHILPSPAICHYLYAAAVVKAYALQSSWPVWKSIFTGSMHPTPKKRKKNPDSDCDSQEKHLKKPKQASGSVASAGQNSMGSGNADEIDEGVDCLVTLGMSNCSGSNFDITTPLQNDVGIVTNEDVFAIMDYITLSQSEHPPLLHENKTKFLNDWLHTQRYDECDQSGGKVGVETV